VNFYGECTLTVKKLEKILCVWPFSSIFSTTAVFVYLFLHNLLIEVEVGFYSGFFTEGYVKKGKQNSCCNENQRK
jgi:hypothetical protein